MSQPIPQVMKAAVIDRFGCPEVLHIPQQGGSALD